MKIAISSNDGEFSQPFSTRFGRCNYFVIIESETQTWKAMSNPAATAHGGAGTKVVQFLSDNDVQAVISGRYGPKAFSALQAAGIQVFQASKGSPKELLDKYLVGKLKLVHKAISR